MSTGEAGPAAARAMPSSNAIRDSSEPPNTDSASAAAAREEGAAGEAGAGRDGHARLDAAQTPARLGLREIVAVAGHGGSPQEVW